HSRANEESVTFVVTTATMLLVFVAAYLLHTRYHVRLSQLIELSIYLVVSVVFVSTLAWHAATLKSRREGAWPHAPVRIRTIQDEDNVRTAFRQNSIVLGYNVHGQPWLWPD